MVSAAAAAVVAVELVFEVAAETEQTAVVEERQLDRYQKTFASAAFGSAAAPVAAAAVELVAAAPVALLVAAVVELAEG